MRVKRSANLFLRLFLCLTLACPALAALDANIVWEVRTGGDDTNGGGYKSDAGTTDYTLQDAAQLSLTDCATSGTTVTTLTSATGGFTAAMVGNVINLSAGTNLTTGMYEITGHTDTNTVTLDRAPDDGGGGVSGATGKVGGALATPGKAADVATVGGHRIWVKSGTYTITTSTPGAAGPVVLEPNVLLTLQGYQTTRGDDTGTRPILDCGGVDLNTATQTMIVPDGGSTAQHVIRNFEIQDTGAGTIYRGVLSADTNNDYCTIERVKVTDAQDYGIGYVTACGCEVDNAGNYGFLNCNPFRCWSHDGSSRGFSMASGDSVADCISSNNGNNGFHFANGGRVIRCVAYGNTGQGFDISTGVNASYIECIAVNNTSYGFDLSTNDGILLRCYDYNNTSGRLDGTGNSIGGGTLTGDPFTNAAGDDFTLNNTAGAGATLRAAGMTMPGQTDYSDLFPLQRNPDAAGGTTAKIISSQLQAIGSGL